MISCLMPKKFHAYSPPLNIRLYSHAASSAKAVWITVQQTRNSHVKQDESANVEDPKLRRKVGESRTSSNAGAVKVFIVDWLRIIRLISSDAAMLDPLPRRVSGLRCKATTQGGNNSLWRHWHAWLRSHNTPSSYDRCKTLRALWMPLSYLWAVT